MFPTVCNSGVSMYITLPLTSRGKLIVFTIIENTNESDLNCFHETKDISVTLKRQITMHGHDYPRVRNRCKISNK